jgi:hypothetical protein
VKVTEIIIKKKKKSIDENPLPPQPNLLIDLIEVSPENT